VLSTVKRAYSTPRGREPLQPAQASYLKAIRSPAMKQDVFERLKHAQIGEPIWQPVIFAILVVLISITLALIFQT
jgi:hypothetical protein